MKRRKEKEIGRNCSGEKKTAVLTTGAENDKRPKNIIGELVLALSNSFENDVNKFVLVGTHVTRSA